MLVPRLPLLICVAAIVLPCMLLAAILPDGAMLAYTIILALILFALGDAVLAYSSLDGIKVELPDVARFAKDREGVLEVKISVTKPRTKYLRLGLALPYQFVSPQEDLRVSLPEGQPVSLLQWRCTPNKRGQYRLDACYLEGVSPLGLWALRGSVPIQTEIRVYPDLSGERGNLAALFLNRGTFGIHAQRQIGKGREFEKLREYIPGDSYDEIHWKATAKRNRPITKVFQIERTQEVYVILDASRLSARLSNPSAEKPTPTEHAQPDTILERFVTSALILGLAAQKQGDLFGLVTFSDHVQNFVRARSGKAHYGACRDALYTLEPHGGNPDFDELCAFLRLRLRRRALLVMLTNLDDPVLAESFAKNIELIHRQHVVLVNMLRPEAARPLFSTPEVVTVDDLYRELGGHALWHDLRELERVLHHRGVHFGLLNHEKMCVELVSQYINVKRRQLL